jgi:pimeloyl-ACP methyl ester carboxylesterase
MVELVLATAAALLATGIAYQAIAVRADRRKLVSPQRLIAIDGDARLHVRCAGAGAPATSLSWSRVQPLVARFTHTCSYDRGGLGWSDLPRGAVSAAGHARQLAGLIRGLALPRPFVLVGHSYGSFVVLAFAAAHPGDVAGVVLVDPIWSSEFAEPSTETRRRLRGGVFLSYVGSLLARVGFVRLSLRLLTSGAPGAARRISWLFGQEAASLLSRLVGEVQKLPPETWPAVAAIWSQPKCFIAMARHLRGLPASAREIAACGSLGRIPLTVVTGGRQPAAAQAEQAKIAALSQHGRQVVAPHSAHWIHLDEPDVVVNAIRDLVERQRARPLDRRTR